MTFTFTIDGEPVAKGRPRFIRATGRTYTPTKTRKFEKRVRDCAALAGATTMDGPLSVTIAFYFPWPKGMWRKTKKRGEEWMDTGRDVDNLAKAVLDACNGVCWHDDRQVAELTLRKRRAAQGEPGRTVVRVEAL